MSILMKTKISTNSVDFIITVYILEIDTETLYMYIYNVDSSLQSPLWGEEG